MNVEVVCSCRDRGGINLHLRAHPCLDVRKIEKKSLPFSFCQADLPPFSLGILDLPAHGVMFTGRNATQATDAVIAVIRATVSHRREPGLTSFQTTPTRNVRNALAQRKSEKSINGMPETTNPINGGDYALRPRPRTG